MWFRAVAEMGFPADALLRSVRRRSGLSQRQLAEQAGVPATTVARIESGASPNPRVGTLCPLLRAAGFELAVIGPNGDPVFSMSADDERVDRGGRHLPAHLHSRTVRVPWDWWGYVAFLSRPDVKPPAWTFDGVTEVEWRAERRQQLQGPLRAKRRAGVMRSLSRRRHRGRSRRPRRLRPAFRVAGR